MDRLSHVMTFIKTPDFKDRVTGHRLEQARKVVAWTREYHKFRRANDPAFRWLCKARGFLTSSLRAKSVRKMVRKEELFGCTLGELKTHIESQFTEGMSWDNHGGWHIDHKRPCASFDLSDPRQALECFHFSNLQPLWSGDNHRKSSLWEGKLHRKEFRPDPFK